jgi:hypothetical protein
MKRRPLPAPASRAALAFAVLGALVAPACSQTSTVVAVRSMERPKDVDFVCLLHTADDHWRGAPLSKCQSDDASNPIESQDYHLHAVVTQESRGELAVVDLGRGPADSSAALVKTDPRTLGYSFLPVGRIPTDVAADPNGEAVFVASGADRRIDILPAEMVRGPADTFYESGEALPWPKIDLSVADGVAASLAVVRDPVIGDRLYASLPDAIPAPKLAVFDLSKGALAPTRLADVTLGTKATAHVGAPTPACDTTSGQPWWATYEACFGGTLPKPKAPTQPTSTRNHLAGIAVVGGKLFAADDAAPVVHVFDLATGVEEQQIGVGSATARLAVSEPVPDEITVDNYAAITTCETMGWLGDGLDHSADSAVVAKLPTPGRCVAHRYVYAVDLVNADAGNGSLIVLDVPVVLARDATGAITKETLDVPGTEMKSPLYCDSPAFPMRRVPLGIYGLGGVNGIPIRAIAFSKHDPPSNASKHGVRCVGWGYNQNPKHAGAEFDATVATKIGAADRRNDEIAWAGSVSPQRLRGVFGLAALSNGSLAVVDVDDYDSLCRGPVETLGAKATGEVTTKVVQRHHPRLARVYNTDARGILNVTLSAGGVVLSNDTTSASGLAHPHLIPFGTTDDRVALAQDVPFALTAETWAATFEGAIPGYVGAAGTFGPTQDPTGGAAFYGLLDPAGHYCRRGVEAPATSAQEATNDFVQITDAICQGNSCSAADHATCQTYFGLDTDSTLLPTRELAIGRTFEDRVEIVKHGDFDKDGKFLWSDAASDTAWQKKLKTCFPGLTRYTVRARASWLVQGSASGYLHRRIPSVATDPSALCVDDATKPRVFHGRAYELPALKKDVKETPIATDESCVAYAGAPVPLFVNPAIKLAIRAGTAPSTRDMMFSLQLRNIAVPLALSISTLPRSVKSLARWELGVDKLNWQQVAVVDSIDRGLSLFSMGDVATSRNFP